MTDPGLTFWLDHVAADGGLWEPSRDRTLVVLPPPLVARYRLPEELLVTDDPDVARSDGIAFLGTGHPVLAQAAEAVLAGGDAGVSLLEPPSGAPPSAAVLQDRARAQVHVGHGRIDAVGVPQPVVHWVLRVGALVTYVLSSDEHVSEQVERWVHVDARRDVPAGVVERLVRAEPRRGALMEPVEPERLARALAEADRTIEAESLRRRAELAREVAGAADAERRRAQAYYADAIAGIERRLQTAAEDRRPLLEARLVATRDERSRRMAEIADKHQARHEVKPYRLHAIGVPALRLAVDVRRGERRYPLELDWLTSAGVFAQPRCPACDVVAPLVAGKAGLGCLVCLAPRTAAPPRTRVPAPAPVTSGPVTPAAVAPAAVPQPRVSASVRAAAREATMEPGPRRSPAISVLKADNLAAKLWNALATGDSRRLRDLIAPGSPAAALHAAFGMDALGLAVGVPDGVRILSFTALSGTKPDGGAITAGNLRAARESYRYALRWQLTPAGAALVEVTPFAPEDDGRFPYYYWWFSRSPSRERAVPPVPGHLDPVTRAILRVAGRLHGLGVAARAAAGWARIADVHAALLGAHDPGVLSAAVHRLVAVRAGEKGTFRAYAQAHGVDEAVLRKADPRLRKLLALGPDRTW